MNINEKHIFKNDRISGILIGAAVGDALGAGYEFGPALAPQTHIYMGGQGAFAPGEWTDDAAQMIAIAQGAEFHDIATPQGQDAIAKNFLTWYFSPAREKDIGIHTANVMRQVTDPDETDLAKKFTQIAKAVEDMSPGTSGGNGALMRTAPVALAKLSNERELVETAITTAMLTHADERSAQASAVWCLAIKEAIAIERFQSQSDLLTLKENLEQAIKRTMPHDAAFWWEQLEQATGADPRDFHDGNGYSVQTLKCAWAAITGTPIPPENNARHFADALQEAVRAGNDADTVACVAGSLLAAIWGLSAIPTIWRTQIHGWPDMRDRDLHALSINVMNKESKAENTEYKWPNVDRMDYSSWSSTDNIAVHPHDSGVILAGFDAARGSVQTPIQIDAIVSLCRMGREDISHFNLDPGNHVEIRIIDEPGHNAHTQLTLADAADTVAYFRNQGKTVLLHCVAAHSRTPTVAALYSIRHKGVAPTDALTQVTAVLTNAHPNSEFTQIILHQKEQS